MPSVPNVMRVTDLPQLPVRRLDSHKGSYGRVLIVGGSRGMAGAAGLAGIAALRGGAGLVTVACPDSVAGIVAGYEPSYLTLPLPSDPQGLLAIAAVDLVLRREVDVIAVGPGLGQSAELGRLFVQLLEQAPVPLVIDADALNLLIGKTDLLDRRQQPTIITPHPGEFARLTAMTVKDVQAHRQELAIRFAREHSIVLALKGHETVVTDGDRFAVNTTGNPGMATGGSGDVLTGLCSALLAGGLEPFGATRLAVHVHGLAGDLAAQTRGQISLIASDLLDALPGAFKQVLTP